MPQHTYAIEDSPFVGGLRRLDAHDETEAEAYNSLTYNSLASPFSEALVGSTPSESEAAYYSLFDELQDEDFDEAVQALTDEAAGRSLAEAPDWYAEEHLEARGVEEWMAGIAAEADQLLGHLERHFAARSPESLAGGEFETVMGEALAAQGHPLDREGFIGALARKARSLAKGAAGLARRGVALAARSVLLGPLLGLLRKLVPSLLRRVLRSARNTLPERVRADADTLASKLGVPLTPATATLAELFDGELARSVVTDGEPELEWEGGADSASDGTVARLDAARAELADRIAEADSGSVLTSELEQFIPAVMAALPLVRAGIGLLGREKVVAFLARPLAELMKGHVGPEATRALSRAIADKGLRLLRLEAQDESNPLLGAEALTSMVEDTVRAVGELPPESLAEPLRLRAEVQEAFVEAAARHLPDEVLRGDLQSDEVEGQSAVWVLLPRGPARRYRYRKCSSVFPTRVSRNVARAIALADGGTLEQRLLDEGVSSWPAEAEVHLYETLPGTHLGHLAMAEARDEQAGPLDPGEFEELTSQSAALLLNQPGLARHSIHAGGVGRRYYRVVLRGGSPTARKRRRRIALQLVLTGPRPALRVHLHLGEREAHRIGELLTQGADVRLVAAFRSLVPGLAARALPARLSAQSRRTPGAELTAQQAGVLASAVGERMVTALAAQLRALAPALVAATRDPAPGVTLTFAFTFADRAALAAGRPDVPTVTVRPGRHHG